MLDFFFQFSEMENWHQFSFVNTNDESDLGNMYRKICKTMSDMCQHDEREQILEKFQSLFTEWYAFME